MSQQEQKQTIWRRIRGRIVPITVGSGLMAHGLKNSRTFVRKTHSINVSKVGPVSLFTHKAKGNLLPRAFAITSNAKKAENIIYIQNYMKGKSKGVGKELFRGISGRSLEQGQKFFRGNIIRPDTLRFSKYQPSKFIRASYATKNNFRSIGANTIKAGLKHQLQGFYSTTKIPNLTYVKSKINLGSKRLWLGAAILGASLYKTFKGEK